LHSYYYTCVVVQYVTYYTFLSVLSPVERTRDFLLTLSEYSYGKAKFCATDGNYCPGVSEKLWTCFLKISTD